MATPINPNHNVRRVAAAASRRLRYDNRPSRQVSVSTPAERAAAALVRAACHVEALRVPLCTQCNLAIPDAQHLTFECPAVLPKIREVLRVVNFAASSDQSLRHLIHSANGTDVLLASLGAFPFQHVLNTHCAYATLKLLLPQRGPCNTSRCTLRAVSLYRHCLRSYCSYLLWC